MSVHLDLSLMSQLRQTVQTGIVIISVSLCMIQTQEGSDEHLFILTWTHSMHIFRKSPLPSHRMTLKQQINGFAACLVVGRLLASSLCMVEFKLCSYNC